MQRSFTFVLLLVVCLVCLGSLAAQDATVWPGADWPTSTPEEQGMDSAKLLDLLTKIEGLRLGLDNLTVIRNGYVVLDANWYPYAPDIPHQLYSSTKSVVSLLAGIALDQGLIESLDQPILDLFPGREIANLDERKQTATVRDVLTMGYSLDCLNDGLVTFEAMHNAVDTIQPILDLPVGINHFLYCDLTPHLMLGALQEALGRLVRDFADEMLFQPLGITDYVWETDSAGVPFGGSNLYLTPADAARIGYLALRNGYWNGQPVVSEDWIATSTCVDPAQCPSYSRGYGYYWWMLPPNLYTALGLGGQFIAVSPAHDLVAVALTSGSAGDNGYGISPLLNSDLIHAIESDAPLPANPDAVAALDAHLAAIANPPEPQSVDPVPDGLIAMSGIPYVLEEPLQLWPEPEFMAEEHFGVPMDFEQFMVSFDTPQTALLELVFSDGHTATLNVGLDGVPRLNDTRFGTLAVTGSWLPGDQVGMKVNFNFIGRGDAQTLTFRLRDDGMRVSWSDLVFGGLKAVHAQPIVAS